MVELHALPYTPPTLLRQPWLVEVRHPDEGTRLFGDTLFLPGYTLDGTMYLWGLLDEGSSVVVPWAAWGTGL
ncbi:hypothetical protein BHS07_08940 [Myxococcus xanthus]|nr:hypothetical protein BHS07_08940 [Myxococcus xanthus]